MGLFSSDDSDEQPEIDQEVFDMRAGFQETTGNTGFDGWRFIDWEAEVVIYQIGHEVDIGPGGYALGGLAAVPLSETAIDTEHYRKHNDAAPDKSDDQ